LSRRSTGGSPSGASTLFDTWPVPGVNVISSTDSECQSRLASFQRRRQRPLAHNLEVVDGQNEPRFCRRPPLIILYKACMAHELNTRLRYKFSEIAAHTRQIKVNNNLETVNKQ